MILYRDPAHVNWAGVSRGQRIRALRRMRGLTQPDLARVLGVHEITVSHWEHEWTIAAKNVVGLAKFFGATTDFLLCLSDQWQNGATLE